MREQTARGLEAARTRTLAADRLRRGRADHPAQPADEPARVGPRPHRPAGGPLAAARRRTRRRRGCWSARSSSCTTPSSTRVPPGSTLPLLTPAGVAELHRDVRGRVFDGLERLDDETPEQLFPYVMVEQHEQQHVETMLATHQLRAGEPLLGAGAPAAGRTGACRPDSVLVPAGPFTLGVDGGTEPWSLDNERPGAHRRPAGLPDRAGPGHQRRVAGVHRRRWLRPAAVVVRARLAPPGRRRAASGRCSGRRTARGAGSATSRRSRPTSRCSTSASSRPRPTPRGRERGCPTEQEWEKACAWDPVTGATAALAVGRRGVDARRWPTSAETRCVPRRWVPTRPAPRPTASSR